MSNPVYVEALINPEDCKPSELMFYERIFKPMMSSLNRGFLLDGTEHLIRMRISLVPYTKEEWDRDLADIEDRAKPSVAGDSSG